MPRRIRVGTSGWYYDHWRGTFYPDDLPKEEMFRFYAKQFDTVEINNTFYRLPPENVVGKWTIDSPADFLFSVKMSRFITHVKTLKNAHKAVETFMGTVSILGEKLGPILVQLAPSVKIDIEKLKQFLDILPKYNLFTFEFRHNSWFCEEVYDALREKNAALCLFELAGVKSPEVATADWVYIRLHGPEKTRYSGSYPDDTLAAWAQKIGAWADQDKRIFCYFDNDEKAYAVGDAQRLRTMVEFRNANGSRSNVPPDPDPDHTFRGNKS